MKKVDKKITAPAESHTVLVSDVFRAHPALLRLKEKLKQDLKRKELGS